ncbi:MAG: phosphotransferase family protein [Alcanivoracaceae bacterium]|nr:phosphotransferase family protein [Alcanivoracaceae bacterium]
MSDVADMNTASLEAYLQKNLAGFKGPLSAEKFSGGQSNPTFLLTASSGQYVLRRKPHGQLLASAHAVDREFSVLRALHGSDVPVAKPLLLCESDDIIGSMFYVMSYEAGRIFWDPALPELAAAERAPIFTELVRVLAALHNVDVNKVGLADYGKPGNYFERQIGRWSKQYRAAETERLADMEVLLDWLPRNMPSDDGQVSLIHGDFRLDNFIFAKEHASIKAVLDWELSTVGHPLADLAYLCMCLRLPVSGFPRGLAGLDRSALGLPEEEQIVAQYCMLRNITTIENWEFYLAFSFFRLAAICQGVMRRALDGNASNERALETGRQTAVLAALGAAIIAGE